MNWGIALDFIVLGFNVATVVLIFLGTIWQRRYHAEQHKVNVVQRDMNLLFHARLGNLERQLPTAENEQQPHVH